MRLKNRLTITLPNDLLKAIDTTIDGSPIRNRSHAIEVLVTNSLQNPLEYAVILTGGDRYHPNPALKLFASQKLINLTLGRISAAGLKTVVICLGKDGDMIKRAVGDGEQWGLSIKYVTEAEPSGSGGALKKAETYIPAEHFLVLHGDIVSNVDLKRFFKFHEQENTLATIVVKPKKSGKSFGKALIEGNQITDFFEKTDSKGIDIVNTGIYCCKQALFNLLPAKGCNLERDIFPILAKERQLTAFLFQGYWYDVSTGKDYEEASKVWVRMKQ
ncbi:hypothetical protein A3B57_00805 [Microgenomates group bacterium RIFCSPLOWO2_01_FULL_47_10]|nr:MAG: hypothetical protein A3B57_00805 [Microgenomates group bacterium RIFCSPLOWO2_01_FULL_47_10]